MMFAFSPFLHALCSKATELIVSYGLNQQHISLKHFGEFIINTPEGKVKLEFEWLDSTYAVMVGDKL